MSTGISSKDVNGVWKRMTVTQSKLFSPRPSNVRNVLKPAGNLQKSSQILKTDTTVKNVNKSVAPSVRGIVSPTVRNSHISTQKTKASLLNRSSVNVKALNHGYRSKNQSTSVSRILPQKECVSNLYNQDFHIVPWQEWFIELPKWMQDIALAEQRKRKFIIPDKENLSPNLNESTNSSYTTIEDELLDSSDVHQIEELEPIIEDTLPIPDILRNGSRRQWRDWSIQISEGKMVITGKSDTGNEIHYSGDVSSCELINSNTLKFNNGMVYELVGMPDHFTNVPCYVRNKFQVGFPEDWKTVKDRWMKYIEEGSPFGFNWSMNDSEHGKMPSEMDSYCSAFAKTPEKTANNVEFPSDLTKVLSEKVHKHIKPLALPRSPIMTEQYKRAYSTYMKESLTKEKKSSVKLDSGAIHNPLQEDNCVGNSPAQSVIIEHTNSKVDIGKIMKTERNVHNTISDDLPEASTDAKSTDSDALPEMPNSKLNVSKMPSSKSTAKKNYKYEKRPGDEVALYDWTPLLDNGEIKIKGYTGSELHPSTAHITDIIEARQSFDSFRCKNGCVYKLLGKFVDQENEIPSEIKKKLAKGLPRNWKMMVIEWAKLNQ